MTRLFLLAALVAGCAAPSAQVRSSAPRFDVSRICNDPLYSAVCVDTQDSSPQVKATPVRVDTNLTSGSFAFPAG